MKNVNNIKNVIVVCYGDEDLKLLMQLLEQLQKCEKALKGYIEKKRASFQSLYFVYDHVILEIISQASNTQAIQPYLQSSLINLFILILIHSNATRFSRCALEKVNKIHSLRHSLYKFNVEVWDKRCSTQ